METKKIEEVARTPLNRERIIEAALRVMDQDGLEAVTMRRVAREVGVEAMSLYNHVHGKDDLLDGICARVMADFRLPARTDEPWIERARFGAGEWRRVLKTHPNVIALFAERQKPMTDLDALRPMEYALSLIADAGLDPRQSVQVFNVMGGYIIGFVMMEVGAMFSAGTTEPGMDAADAEALARTFPPGQLPCITAALPHLATCDPDEQFEFGLDLMLTGLQTRFGIPSG